MTSLALRPVNISVYSLFLLCILVQLVVGNVEKIIFTGPPPSIIANTNPTLSSLNIRTLTNDELSTRTNLDRVFTPEQTNQQGKSSWVLLTNLTENQRYELRVCWSALVMRVVQADILDKEPTRFDMEAYTIDTVLESPQLLKSLNTYAASRHDDRGAKTHVVLPDNLSALLVEIHAAADYFTDDKELMSNPPPVLVDLILDPFLFNVIPQSLLPTIGYLGLLGITTWFVARWIASSLQSVGGAMEPRAKKRN